MYDVRLKNAIAKSGMSLTEICVAVKAFGFKTGKTYLSKLQNGKIPPAGDDLNDALAQVLNIDSVELRTAAYQEKIPKDVLEHLKGSGSQKEVI